MLIDVWPLSHNDLVRSEVDLDWTVSGRDPHFFLHLGSDGLTKGHYNFVFDFESPGTVFSSVRLYFDFGGGFSEVHAKTFAAFPLAGKRRTVPICLSGTVTSIRLDPDLPVGAKFRLRVIEVHRVARLQWYLTHLAREALAVGASPGGFLRLARRAMGLFRAGGVRQLSKVIRERSAKGQLGFGQVSTPIYYQRWIKLNELENEGSLRGCQARPNAGPLISVLVPTYNTPAKLLRECIESVIGQDYENWELCIADDASTSKDTLAILRDFAEQDARIRVDFRRSNGHISAATNSAFDMSRGEWIALLDHDDVLAPHALAEVAHAILSNPDAQILYSDEDKLNDEGHRIDPFFKPAFSPDFFRSVNYLNHLTVHRSDNIRKVGGWRLGFEGSQDYDLNLRIFEIVDSKSIIHIPKVLYHWRAVAGSTALAVSEKSYPFKAGLRALEEHINRTGLQADVEPAPGLPYYRVRYKLPDPLPLVSIIIPTKDGVNLLRACIESIISSDNQVNYEIIVVDNQSTKQETFEYFQELRLNAHVRVLSFDRPFNYSAINNYAAQEARGDLLCLMNNDIVVISPSWLDEMVSWAIQGRIGCVGAKLYYGDDTVQHGGVVLGIGGVAGHSHKHSLRHDHGYFSRLVLTQNVSAVTGACLVVRKELFHQVGGLNETDLPVAFNDVDFCLKVRQAGFCNLWTPYAELYHLESVSRGTEDSPEKIARFNGEVKYMLERWHTMLLRDPYYSPNLTLKSEDFAINTSGRVPDVVATARRPIVVPLGAGSVEHLASSDWAR